MASTVDMTEFGTDIDTLGFPIRVSIFATHGKPVLFTEESQLPDTPSIFVHPIDYIWVAYKDIDILTVHEVAMTWIVDEANAKFDAAIALLLEPEIDWKASAQKEARIYRETRHAIAMESKRRLESDD